MARLIRHRRVVDDSWQRLEPGAHGALPALAEDGEFIVPLPLWLARRGELTGRPGRLGVWLDSHEAPEAIAADVGRFSVIAVNFPKFQDGRGFSTGRLLRERFGYRGELRAFGHLTRDHLQFLEACGFDAMLLREGEDAEAALAAFGTLRRRFS